MKGYTVEYGRDGKDDIRDFKVIGLFPNNDPLHQENVPIICVDIGIIRIDLNHSEDYNVIDRVKKEVVELLEKELESETGLEHMIHGKDLDLLMENMSEPAKALMKRRRNLKLVNTVVRVALSDESLLSIKIPNTKFLFSASQKLTKHQPRAKDIEKYLKDSEARLAPKNFESLMKAAAGEECFVKLAGGSEANKTGGSLRNIVFRQGILNGYRGPSNFLIADFVSKTENDKVTTRFPPENASSIREIKNLDFDGLTTPPDTSQEVDDDDVLTTLPDTSQEVGDVVAINKGGGSRRKRHSSKKKSKKKKSKKQKSRKMKRTKSKKNKRKKINKTRNRK